MIANAEVQPTTPPVVAYTYRTGTADAAGFDEYEDIFGAGSRTSAPAPDTEAAIALTFSEAFHGVQKRLQLDDETINV